MWLQHASLLGGEACIIDTQGLGWGALSTIAVWRSPGKDTKGKGIRESSFGRGDREGGRQGELLPKGYEDLS